MREKKNHDITNKEATNEGGNTKKGEKKTDIIITILYQAQINTQYIIEMMFI